MNDPKKLDLSTLVAGAIAAEEQEKYEVLDAISKSMTDQEREVFFAAIEVVKKGLIPAKENKK